MMGRYQLDQNKSGKYLGRSAENRYSRIMVTMPPEAAENYKFIL